MPDCLLHTRPLADAQLKRTLPAHWASRLHAVQPGGEHWRLVLEDVELAQLGALLSCNWLRRLACVAPGDV